MTTRCFEAFKANERLAVLKTAFVIGLAPLVVTHTQAAETNSGATYERGIAHVQAQECWWERHVSR
jgi:hypothetical protein